MSAKGEDPSDIVDRLRTHMEMSRTIHAPVEQIPAKVVAVIELINPWLVGNTTPREAGIVMAVVYAYYAAILTRDTGGDTELAVQQAHDLLDAAITIVSDLASTNP